MPRSALFLLFPHQAVRFLVDALPGADGDDLNPPVLCGTIDDPEPAHTIASQTEQFFTERFSRERIGNNRMKSRLELLFNVRMEVAENLSRMIGDTKPVGSLRNGEDQSKSSSSVY